MKNIILLLLAFSCVKASLSQTGKPMADSPVVHSITVHFQLDISAELKNVKSPVSIGIRGNTAPLSWEKTTPMTFNKKSGLYETNISFDITKPNQRIKYEYYHDTSWENIDPRVIIPKRYTFDLPVDKWDSLPFRNSTAYIDSMELQQLTETISNLDSLLFDAYNNCKMDVYASMFSEDLEFYHDKGGLSTSKKDMVEAVKKNICNKVARELLKGSIEVSPIPGFGAIEIGSHRFHNLVEKSTSGYAKFVVAWQYKDGAWKVTRVISLHK